MKEARFPIKTLHEKPCSKAFFDKNSFPQSSHTFGYALLFHEQL